MRLRLPVILAALLALAAAPAVAAASRASIAQGSRPVVDIVEVSGVLDPTLVEYVSAQIADANRRGSTLIVLELDSAGALDVSLESLVRQVLASRAPVAVWVGPRRASAQSGAALLLAAASVPAMATTATIGPIHPADLTIPVDSPAGNLLRERTMSLTSTFTGGDASPYLDRRLEYEEAVGSGAVLFATRTLAELLKELDGETVRAGGASVTLRLPPDEATVRFHKPGPIRRLVHVLTNATLVYLLLLFGAGLIVFEVFQPGFGVAGVTGALLLVAAVAGMLVLPVAWWAVALVVAGLGLLTADVAIHGLGIPSAAGTVLLLAGSLKLFPAPTLRPATWIVLVTVAGALIFFVPVMTVVLRARQPIGREVTRALLGKDGEVRSVLNPEGFVWVEGALWRARSDDGSRMRVGEPVEVTGTDGEVLQVRRAGALPA